MSIEIQKVNIVDISFGFKLDKKFLLLLLLISKLGKRLVNMSIISVNAYYSVSKLKKALIFFASMKNLEF